MPEPPSGGAPALKRELGLRDLTLFIITTIVGTRWIVAAALAGPGSILLWLLAAVFFVVPLAFAVATLTVKYPGAGGLYIWTRNDFGQWPGFLCFWVYWMSMAVWFPGAAMFYMSVGLHSLGPGYSHLADNRFCVLAASLAAIWIALGTNILGLRIGKWTQNIGGLAAWLLGVVLVAVAIAVLRRNGSATPLHFTPDLNWPTLGVFATIAYATSGLEMAGMMGDEIRDPRRTLPRAAWIGSIFITIFYACSTFALLVLLQPANLNEMYGLAQGGETAAQALRMPWLAPLVAVLALASGVGQLGGIGTAVSRLPLAAGVDHLLPSAFSRIHPRWSTPHVSILALGAVSSLLLIAIQIGDTLRAAYQAIVGLMIIAGFLPYLYVFSSAWKAGRRLSALSGQAVTTLAILFALIPTAEVTSVWLFEAKLAAGTLAAIASAWFVYRRNRKSQIAC